MADEPRFYPSLTFTLPLPPGVNEQYVTVRTDRPEGQALARGRRGGRTQTVRALSPVARRFKQEVKRVLLGQRDRSLLDERLLEVMRREHWAVSFTFYFESPHLRDLDGGLKIALDAIAAGLDLSDRRVVDVHLTKRVDAARPRTEVEIEPVTGWTF